MATTNDYTIDAGGKTLGRVAAAAAKALMGKTRADYTPHVDSKVTVRVTNVSKLHITEKKRTGKTYQRYSGYPGGLREESLAHLAARRGHAEVFRKAVERMLPRNTMRTPRLKRLIITD
jgi:large subunit ribosomal protein L13